MHPLKFTLIILNCNETLQSTFTSRTPHGDWLLVANFSKFTLNAMVPVRLPMAQISSAELAQSCQSTTFHQHQIHSSLLVGRLSCIGHMMFRRQGKGCCCFEACMFHNSYVIVFSNIYEGLPWLGWIPFDVEFLLNRDREVAVTQS